MKEPAKVFLSRDINKIVQKIDAQRLGKNVGIKVHFGEKGCVTFVNPEIVKTIYKKIISFGKKSSLIETNVLYRGERTKKDTHIKLAKAHGFNFAPIDILDGIQGEAFVEIPIEKGLISSAKLGKGILKYDSLVVISHFKGHHLAGYGGAFKNLGMGFASRAGKFQMHALTKPKIDTEKCVGCGLCVKSCNFKAITINKKTGKAEINPEKCAGCTMCIAVCPKEAVEIPWEETSENLQKKIVDYASGVLKIIPKEKIQYVNVLEKITEKCDCMEEPQKPVIEDIGILYSTDPVAIDKASLDLAISSSDGKFEKINSVDKYVQVEYAFRKGLGKKDYKLFNLD